MMTRQGFLHFIEILDNKKVVHPFSGFQWKSGKVRCSKKVARFRNLKHIKGKGRMDRGACQIFFLHISYSYFLLKYITEMKNLNRELHYHQDSNLLMSTQRNF